MSSDGHGHYQRANSALTIIGCGDLAVFSGRPIHMTSIVQRTWPVMGCFGDREVATSSRCYGKECCDYQKCAEIRADQTAEDEKLDDFLNGLDDEEPVDVTVATSGMTVSQSRAKPPVPDEIM